MSLEQVLLNEAHVTLTAPERPLTCAIKDITIHSHSACHIHLMVTISMTRLNNGKDGMHNHFNYCKDFNLLFFFFLKRVKERERVVTIYQH